MTNIRAMFVGQGVSGLPEDRIVNVFHFVGTGAYEADAANAAGRVINFYNGLASGQTNPVGSYLSSWVNRTAEVRTYDLTTAKPRVPTITPFEIAAFLSNSGLPEEVCIVTTFYGSPPVTRRRRGRLYIGPINGATTAINYGSQTGPSAPNQQMILDLRDATKALAVPGTVQWCIRSSLPSENFVPVAAGYVDNAFDTQRRRGPDATTREQWTNILP